MIALTFDDGPSTRYTPEILDILSRYDVRATFFLIGRNAEEHPELVLRLLSEGHEIGNHTYSHTALGNLDKNGICREIDRAERVLYELAEYRPKLFRPPEGCLRDTVISAAEEGDYTVILWNIDTQDWAHTPAEQIAQTVLNNIDSGDILLFHDFIVSPSPTPRALEVIIPALLQDGYQIVTVSELLCSE